MRAASAAPTAACAPPTTSARRVKVMPLQASVIGGLFFFGISGLGPVYRRFRRKLSNLPVRRMNSEFDNFRSEEHTSELQSLMRISYAVFCLKKKIKKMTNISVNSEYNHKT